MIFTTIGAFFKLMRWFHELLAILPFLSLYLVIQFFAKQQGISCQIKASDFIVLCFCIQLLIAAGCVLNDIADRETDRINKPLTHIVGNTISLKTAWILFFILSLSILLFSIYISLFMFTEWAYIASTVYVLSLAYDFYFKRSPLMGNILMAILTAFIPLVLFLFAKDCIRALDNPKVNLLIWLFAALPFLIIIPRELSLDISDMEGDRAMGCRTLPIVIGAKRSKIIVAIFLLFIIALSIPLALIYNYLSWSLAITDLMILIYLVKLGKTESRIEYIRIGRFLWFVMIVGLIGFTLSTIFL